MRENDGGWKMEEEPFRVIKKSIYDKTLNTRHFYYLNNLYNNKDSSVYDYKKRPKTYDDLCKKGYFKIRLPSISLSVPKVEFEQDFEVIEINNNHFKKILNDELIIKQEMDYRERKGWYFNDTHIEKSQVIKLRSNLIRLYCYILSENNNRKFNFKIKELERSIKTTGYPIDLLLSIMKNLGICTKESGLYFSIEEPEPRIKSKDKATIEAYNLEHFSRELSDKVNDKFNHTLSVIHSDLIPKNKSGVYLYTNELKEILYIGKAKDLRSRTFSHLNGQTNTIEIHSEFKYISIFYIENSKYKEVADHVEKDLIKTLVPKYNVIYNKSA